MVGLRMVILRWRLGWISWPWLDTGWCQLGCVANGVGFVFRGIGSVWAPACQDSSHVGHAGVDVVSLKGAPLSLPTLATAGFSHVFCTGYGDSMPFASGVW